MINTLIRGVSPDKTDCFDKQSRWPIILPATSLQQNDPKDTKTDTKVAAEPLLAGCFFICLPQGERGYHIATDNANRSPSSLTVPMNAAGISRGGLLC